MVKQYRIMKYLTTITLIIGLICSLANYETVNILAFLSFKITAFLLTYFSWRYSKSHLIEKANKFNKWVDKTMIKYGN